MSPTEAGESRDADADAIPYPKTELTPEEAAFREASDVRQFQFVMANNRRSFWLTIILTGMFLVAGSALVYAIPEQSRAELIRFLIVFLGGGGGGGMVGYYLGKRRIGASADGEADSENRD